MVLYTLETNEVILFERRHTPTCSLMHIQGPQPSCMVGCMHSAKVLLCIYITKIILFIHGRLVNSLAYGHYMQEDHRKFVSLSVSLYQPSGQGRIQRGCRRTQVKSPAPTGSMDTPFNFFVMVDKIEDAKDLLIVF